MRKPFSEKLAKSRQLMKLFANTQGVCVSCSFGKDSMVVLHLALQENAKIPVVFENTLVEFPETIRFAHELVNDWELNYFELRPAKGINFWTLNDRITKEHLRRDDGRKHSNICCYHLKEKPFSVWRKQYGVKASLTGVTASESRNRMFTACQKGMEYYSTKDDLYKIHPLMYWTPLEVWNFINDYSLPSNPAYAKYDLNRIGCMWCMSHVGWREQVAKINPKVYSYIMRRYLGTPTLLEA